LCSLAAARLVWLVLQDEPLNLHNRIRNRGEKFGHPGVIFFLFSRLYNHVSRTGDCVQAWKVVR